MTWIVINSSLTDQGAFDFVEYLSMADLGGGGALKFAINI